MWGTCSGGDVGSIAVNGSVVLFSEVGEAQQQQPVVDNLILNMQAYTLQQGETPYGTGANISQGCHVVHLASECQNRKVLQQ